MAQVHHVIDRGYRELVEALPRPEMLSTACLGLADALDVDVVLLVRRDENGTLECEAASRETAWWAELVLVPERWDGGVAGNGPASRALHALEAIEMAVDDPGFLPWRAAALDDGLVRISAARLDTEQGAWVLLFGTADRQGRMGFRAEDPAGVAMRGCGRLIDAGEKLDRQRLLSSAIDESGNAAFVTDAEGRIEWCNGALSRLTGYPPGDIVGRHPRFLSSGRHGVRHYRELWTTLRKGETWRGETVDRDRAGTAFTASQTITPFAGYDGEPHYVAIYDDRVRRGHDLPSSPAVPALADVALFEYPAFAHKLEALLAQRRPLRLGLVAVRRQIHAEGPDASGFDLFLGQVQARVLALAGTQDATCVAPGEFLVLLPEDADRAQMLVEALRRELTESYPLTGKPGGIYIRVVTAHAPADGSSLALLVHAARDRLGAERRPVAAVVRLPRRN